MLTFVVSHPVVDCVRLGISDRLRRRCSMSSTDWLRCTAVRHIFIYEFLSRGDKIIINLCRRSILLFVNKKKKQFFLCLSLSSTGIPCECSLCQRLAVVVLLRIPWRNRSAITNVVQYKQPYSPTRKRNKNSRRKREWKVFGVGVDRRWSRDWRATCFTFHISIFVYFHFLFFVFLMIWYAIGGA